MSLFAINLMNNNVIQFSIKTNHEKVRDTLLQDKKMDNTTKKAYFEIIEKVPKSKREAFYEEVVAELNSGNDIAQALSMISDKMISEATDTPLKGQLENNDDVIGNLAQEFFEIRKTTIAKLNELALMQQRITRTLEMILEPMMSDQSLGAKKDKEKTSQVAKSKFVPGFEKKSSVNDKSNVQASEVVKKKRKNSGKTSRRRAKLNQSKTVLKPVKVEKNREEKRLQKKKSKAPALVSTTIDASDVQKVFFDHLLNQSKSCGFKITPRVKRWEKPEIVKNIELVRNFVDIMDGEAVYQYSQLSHKELRAKIMEHNAEKTEWLLLDQYINIYALATPRGYEMKAKLVCKDGKAEKGKLFIGCDGRKNIFHRQFVKKQMTSESFYQPKIDGIKIEPEMEIENLGNNHVSISVNDGIVKFEYETHSLFIYPSDKELLEKEVPMKKD